MIISNQMIIPNLKIISGRPGGGIVPGSQPSGVQVRGRGGVTDIANLFIFRKTVFLILPGLVGDFQVGANIREAGVPLLRLRWRHLWHHRHLPGGDLGTECQKKKPSPNAE